MWDMVHTGRQDKHRSRRPHARGIGMGTHVHSTPQPRPVHVSTFWSSKL